MTGKVEHSGFLLFLALVTIALGLVAAPFLQPLIWATLAAIMFQPMYLWFLKRLPGRTNQAALATLLVIIIAVVLPALLIGSLVIEQAASVVLAFQRQELDIVALFNTTIESLPGAVQQWLDQSGWSNLQTVTMRLQQLIQDSIGLIAQHALAIGGSLAGIVLAFGLGLYASFYLLRDGQSIGETVLRALPFDRSIADRLAERFLSIVRATIKGSIVVGLVQGVLGALTFWIVGFPSVVLLGVLMAIASLLPAVGTGIVWVPVAIYLLANGQIWQGLVVVGSGIGLVGMADNVLRPILVGRDTGIPDWVILVTTLGGLSLFGLSGIIIGPLIAGLFITGWSIYSERREETAA